MTRPKFISFCVESVVFVVDREPAITNALETVLPNATVVHCWNHIKRDVRYWLISHKTPNERIPAYINHVDRLLKCSDEDELKAVENEICEGERWSSAFTTYYQSRIRPDICKYSGKWILEETGFYDPYSGITNNASESFNVVLKWMNDQGLTNVLPGCQGQVQNLVRQVHFSVVCPAGQVQILIFQVFRTVRQLVIYYQRDKKWHPTDSQ